MRAVIYFLHGYSINVFMQRMQRCAEATDSLGPNTNLHDQAAKPSDFKCRLPEVGHAVATKVKSCLGRKNPDRSRVSRICPVPRRGKVPVEAQEHSGLTGAGKTGNGYALQGNAAPHPVQAFWNLVQCKSRWVFLRPNSQRPAPASRLEPTRTARPPAHSTTPQKGDEVFV